MQSLPPPPRSIETTFRQPVLMALLWSVFAASVAAVLFFVGVAIHEVILRGLGRDVTAAVQSIHEHPNSSGGYDRIARYKYALPGGLTRTDESEVAWSEFRRLSMPFITVAGRPDDMHFPKDAPAELTVRAYAIGPLAYSRAVEHDHAAFYLPIAALFAAVCGLLAFALYLNLVTRPRRRRRIITHGVAAPGQVVDRRVHHSRYGSTYYVRYAFTPAVSAAAPASTPITVEGWVPGQAEHDAANPGTAVTVLHDPRNPHQSVIYEYCGYRCTA